MAIKNNGSLWTWGLNSEGQLGDNTLNDHHAPQAISGLCSLLNSINETSLDHTLRIFPNPAISHITVDSEQNSPAIVTIYNSLGQELSIHKFSRLAESTINLSLKSGIYYIRVDTDQFRTVKKLIIR
jgi:alpha-tubulin suppressor-like RCC1 family protein